MGVFLVIAVGAAILVFKPSVSPVSEITYRQLNGEQRSATTDAAELIRDDSYRGLQDPAAVSLIQENRISVNGAGAAETSAGGTAATVISVPKPSAAAVPDTTAVKPAAPRQPASSRPAASRPAAQAKPAVQGTASGTKPAGSAAPKRAYNDYWVQAGSFSTRERADGVKHTLDDKGIAAMVTNQEINGNTYYRVRVGPYSSQNEADYWLAMIKSIDGFQDSQIWESQSLR